MPRSEENIADYIDNVEELHRAKERILDHCTRSVKCARELESLIDEAVRQMRDTGNKHVYSVEDLDAGFDQMMAEWRERHATRVNPDADTDADCACGHAHARHRADTEACRDCRCGACNCARCEPDEEEKEAACPACGGKGLRLGVLGRLLHFRCRACGMQFNRRINPAPAAPHDPQNVPFSAPEAARMEEVLAELERVGVIPEGTPRAIPVRNFWIDLSGQGGSAKWSPDVGPSRHERGTQLHVHPAVFGYDHGKLRFALDALEDDVLFHPKARFRPGERDPGKDATRGERALYDAMRKAMWLDELWRRKLGMARLDTLLRYGSRW